MHLRQRSLAIGFGVLLSATLNPQSPRPAASGADTLTTRFESDALPNGLTVVLAPDKTTPTVAVNVWYTVGSKDEAVGRDIEGNVVGEK